MGEWFFPDGMRVDIKNNNGDIYRDRTGAESTPPIRNATVRLNRRKNAMNPIGLYCCEIPGESGAIQKVYVGIHADSKTIVRHLGIMSRIHILPCSGYG